MARFFVLGLCVELLVASMMDVACACGGAIQGSGVMQSPNYPSTYPNSTSCTWTLQASPAHGSIILQFTAFSTQQCCDFLQITDSDDSSYTFSGSALPPNLTLGQRATVIFTSDASVVFTGFSINFTTIVIPCGGVINGSGNILSPNYPNNYPCYADCTWDVYASGSFGRIFLQFNSFAIEEDYDFLTISDGNGFSATFTAYDLPPNITLSQRATIVFTSDFSVVYSGFSISVTTIGCTGRNSGVFSPPAFVAFPSATLAPWAVISTAPERSSIECSAACLNCDVCVALIFNPTSRACSLLNVLPSSLPAGTQQLYVLV